MSKIKACFIKDGQAYIEIQPSKLHIEGTKILEYPDRCFYYFGGYLMEVSRKNQKELFKEKNRNKYLRNVKRCVGTVSLDNFITDELQGYNILIDPTNYEELCIRKIMGKMAMKAVAALPSDEYDLIINICINGMPERTYAEKVGIPRMTIHDRKERILKQLREKIKK